MSTATAAHRRAEPTGLPIGPESLTWKIFGDNRGLIIVGRTGVLQTMHPTINQALIDHSDYFENPLNRILRSSPPILGVIYDEPRDGTPAWVRDRHRGMKGQHIDGKRYRALDPDAFWWAHATFFESQIAQCELFHRRPLTIEEKRQLYLETITWYSRYGLSMRIVPESYEAFEEYWARMFAEVLAATPVAASALSYAPLPAPFPSLEQQWKVAGPIIARTGPWLTRTVLPPEAQVIFDIETSLADRAALEALRRYVKTTWPLMPANLKRNAQVRAADAREGYED